MHVRKLHKMCLNHNKFKQQAFFLSSTHVSALYSLVPRPSQLFNASHFSACNIEKLGGPGDKAKPCTLQLAMTLSNWITQCRYVSPTE